MGKLKRLVLTANDSIDHINWLLGLKSGFQALGIDVLTVWPYPDTTRLNAVIEGFKPDAIFEINRSKDMIETRKNLFHVTFIQDFWAYEIYYADTTGESDLYYTMLPPANFGYSKEVDDRAKVIFPSSSMGDHYLGDKAEKRFDMGLIGHMGTLDRQLLMRPILPSIPKIGRYIDLIKSCRINHTTICNSLYASRIRSSVYQFLENKGLLNPQQDYKIIFDKCVNLCTMTFTRTINRSFIASAMLDVSDKVGFWGSRGWQANPKFSPYYQGFLSGSAMLANAYQSLHLNIHCTGTNIHPRIVDAMVVGVPNAIVRNDADETRFGITSYLERDVDYIDLDCENFVDKLSDVLKEPKYLAELGKRGREKALKLFTWERICTMVRADIEAKL